MLIDYQKAAVLCNYNGHVLFNVGFQLLADHYGFTTQVCQLRWAHTKGKVERMVKYLKENFFVCYRHFDSFAHLNQQLEQWLAKVHAMLRLEGQRLSEKVVCKLMVEEQLVVSRSRRRRYSSYCGETGQVPDNLLARNFKAGQPNQKWLMDINEFEIPGGKVWLSPVVNCFDGKAVSFWSISTRPDAELTNTMLEIAIDTLSAGEYLIIHSDRGGHYRWSEWLERVNTAGLIRSMSRKGCSPDNAACEGFIGRLKMETYYGR